MKVNLNLNTDGKKVNFEGYRSTKTDLGEKEYEFNFPFDSNNYDCYLELFDLDKDDNGNYQVNENDIMQHRNGENAVKLKPGVNKINLFQDFFLPKASPFAYHYKLVRKGTDLPAYRLDAGSVIDYAHSGGKPHEVYNFVLPNSPNVTKGGAMKLVLPDSYNVSWVYEDKTGKIIPNKNLDKAQKSVKNFANKIGGSLAGIEKDVEDGKFKEFSRIISTPIFTDDDITAHAYWNRNCMQTAQSLGSINNYASLQRKMFSRGINFVSDGAYVNEGLEGIHFKHILKWGSKSPFYHWFRISGLSESPLNLGVFAKNKKNIAHRLVNPKYIYKEHNGKIVKDRKNPNWDKKLPTYFQIYDKTLVDVAKLDPQKPIIAYDSTNVLDGLKVNTHNDTVIPYKFEIKNKTYEKNIERLNEYNKEAPKDKQITLDSPMAAKFLSKFENFELDEKNESGFETWDANPDIAKLNFVFSHSDTQVIKQSMSNPVKIDEFIDSMKEYQYEVQDYAITSGKYWTKKTSQILNLYTAQNLQNIKDKDADAILNKIENNIDKGIYPATLRHKVNKQVIENVLNGSYKLKGNRLLDKDYKEYMVANLMDTPLDSIEVGDDISAVLSSPYMTKRARNEKELGASRFDLVKNGQHINDEYASTYAATNKMYNTSMYMLADEILDYVNEKLPEESKLYNRYQDTTPYGKYVLPILTAEIAKFAVIKSVNPKAKVIYDKKTGEISYDYKNLKANTSLRKMGIVAESPKQEAASLIYKLKKNMNKRISVQDKKDIAAALFTSIKGTDYKSFALSEMLVDRAEAGLDWRIDATKDIGDMESLRNGMTPYDYTLNEKVTEFWKNFTQNVMDVNPNTYIAAEITNEMDPESTVKKFLNKTGMTATANYRFLFTDIPKIFAKAFETGDDVTNDGGYLDKLVFNKMIGGEHYLKSSNLPSLLYSYSFIGNHDKPRALHCLALDMGLFMTQNDIASFENKEKAYRLLHDNFFGNISADSINNYDYKYLSFKNIAMCDSLRKGFIDALNYLKEAGKLSEEEHQNMFKSISQSIQDIVHGRYTDKTFEADAFGVKPFDVNIELVIENAKTQHYFSIDPAKEELIKEQTFETIIDPAISKLMGIMKFLVALPGNPTIFAGDDLGATGYEEKTKNMYVQNRSYLHNEWADKNDKHYKPFIAKHKKELDEIMSLRSRPELNALNDGTPFTLGLQKTHDGRDISGILRQNVDGAMAVSLFNTGGIHHDYTQYYTPQKSILSEINLDADGNLDNVGMIAGLKEGTIFRNAYNKDDIYEVARRDNHYYLKHQNNSDIVIEDSILVLYSEPEKNAKNPSFTGSKILYNPQYNFACNPYSQVKNKKVELGSKLQLTSR